jgi:hypothetical protein
MFEVCEIRRFQVVKLGIAAKRRIAKAKAEKLCVACLQPLYGVQARGCHYKCYRATLRAIEKGLTTEAERMVEGKLLPCARPGRVANPVMLELTKGQADES